MINKRFIRETVFNIIRIVLEHIFKYIFAWTRFSVYRLSGLINTMIKNSLSLMGIYAIFTKPDVPEIK